MTQTIKFGKNTISIHSDGQIFVNGNFTGIIQWKSDPKRYKNRLGTEIAELKDKSLEVVLKLRGYL